jgi:CRP-like cAMP-binding protein
MQGESALWVIRPHLIAGRRVSGTAGQNQGQQNLPLRQPVEARIMKNETPEAPAEVVGVRLIETFEGFLQKLAQRDDDLAKLLIVMGKLSKQISDLAIERLVAQPAESSSDFTDAINRLTDVLERQPWTSPPIASAQAAGSNVELDSRIIEAIERLTVLSVPVPASMESSPANEQLADLLARQTEANELVVRLMDEQSRNLADAQAKHIPEQTGEERRGDLEYTAYDEPEFTFLKESEVFGALSDDTLRTIRANGRIENYPAGKTMFAIGDPVNEVFIVKSGIAEVCRPTEDPDKLSVVAYLTSGDSIGEMSILMAGDTRSSIARVPEGAEVLVLTHEVFMKLFKGLPELALRLASVFARRLKTSIKKERIQKRHRELQGNLQYFDLSTVVQTLLSSDERTGMLTVFDEQEETLSELFFESGRIRFARLGHIVGEDAFYQLFQNDLTSGSFTFKEGRFPEGFEQTTEITSPGMSMLFEAARLSDELALLKEDISDPDQIFTPIAQNLEWEDTYTTTLANGIWSMLRRKSSVFDILESIPRSHHAIYSVLTEMLKNGQIEK